MRSKLGRRAPYAGITGGGMCSQAANENTWHGRRGAGFPFALLVTRATLAAWGRKKHGAREMAHMAKSYGHVTWGMGQGVGTRAEVAAALCVHASPASRAASAGVADHGVLCCAATNNRARDSAAETATGRALPLSSARFKICCERFAPLPIDLPRARSSSSQTFANYYILHL